MKDILDPMEEHIASIRNLQRSFDYIYGGRFNERNPTNIRP
jgi:hypothetical protein